LPANVSLPMSPSRPRWLASVISEHMAARAANRVVESCPPSVDWPHRAWSSRIGRWLGASAWFVADPESIPALGNRRRTAITRSLHELWHLRGEVFGHVSRRYGQTEAELRLTELDGHFPKRMRRAGFATRAPLIGDDAGAMLRLHRRAGANDGASG